ncbi:sirohydrochlorin chelatase [Crateriforma spongiae]|uniref:sirohydrochlorin chelatase n=1 Tax=Crateriforma spongiae TaxID=2724528 RepID=UPI001F36EEC7|nr:sirohydrochlorin chelatase [Crateriforma spongiae]
MLLKPLDKLSDADESAGLLLIGHGTRDRRGTEEFFRLAELVRQRMAPRPVAEALLEFQTPTISDAWQCLVDQGVGHVRVAPLLLFAAGHAKQDIPEAVAAAALQTPGVIWDQCGPISRQADLIRWVAHRIAQCGIPAARIGRDRTVSGTNAIGMEDTPISETAVIMVGRGSHDPCAQADMRVLTEVVARRFPDVTFDTAFYAMAQPRLPEVIDRVVSMRRPRRIIVQPHLLFMGRLYEAIQDQVDQANVRHRDVTFVVGDYLGPVQAVADALADRAGLGRRVAAS